MNKDKNRRSLIHPSSFILHPFFSRSWMSRPLLTGVRRAASLMEVVIVMTVLAVLIALSVPSCRRAVEQSRAEIAAANLRAVWSAQRLYWLEHRTYATSLADLGPLLDPAIMSASAYVYAISAADGTTFTATATRTGS